MNPKVSVVIPTVGRPSVDRAVRSVLDQTLPVAEIIVVADTDRPVTLPSDDRIVLLSTGGGSGPARCRQKGIDAFRAFGFIRQVLADFFVRERALLFSLGNEITKIVIDDVRHA